MELKIEEHQGAFQMLGANARTKSHRQNAISPADQRCNLHATAQTSQFLTETMMHSKMPVTRTKQTAGLISNRNKNSILESEKPITNAAPFSSQRLFSCGQSCIAKIAIRCRISSCLLLRRARGGLTQAIECKRPPQLRRPLARALQFSPG